MTGFAYGVFRPTAAAPARVGALLGTSVVDLAALSLDVPPDLLAGPTREPLLAAGRPAARSVQQQVEARMATGDVATWPVSEVEALLPFRPGDYVDFYSSI